MKRRVVINSDTLWEWLRRNHLTHGEFARRVGVTAGYLSQLLSGERSPSTRLTERLMEVTRLAFNDLFRFEEVINARQ